MVENQEIELNNNFIRQSRIIITIKMTIKSKQFRILLLINYLEEIRSQTIATKQVRIILITANMTNQINMGMILDMGEETVQIHMVGEMDLNNQDYHQLQEKRV